MAADATKAGSSIANTRRPTAKVELAFQGSHSRSDGPSVGPNTNTTDDWESRLQEPGYFNRIKFSQFSGEQHMTVRLHQLSRGPKWTAEEIRLRGMSRLRGFNGILGTNIHERSPTAIQTGFKRYPLTKLWTIRAIDTRNLGVIRLVTVQFLLQIPAAALRQVIYKCPQLKFSQSSEDVKAFEHRGKPKISTKY